MKHLTFLLFLSLPALLPAQSYCDYNKLYREGKAFAKKRQYKMALYKFNSARRCDPSKGEPVDAAIEALLDQIEGEKRTADRERKRAEEAKQAADQERKQAEEAREMANRERDRAEEEKRAANQERERTEKALEKVKKATAKIVDNILRDADNDIYRLDYEAALVKMKSAATLGVEQQKVSDALLELVFWYAETGRSERALGVLDTAARLLGRENNIAPLVLQMPGDSTQARRLLRDAIRRLNLRRDSFLRERYFPVMITIKGGEFQMGSENGGEDEKPVHSVRLSDFKMARTETTWWQYNLFCAATAHKAPEKPAGWGGEGDNPVIVVTWYDAVAYSNWLSQQEGAETAISGMDEDFGINLRAPGYRLPTEAEWEYAARGGAAPDSTEYAGSNDLNEVGWHLDNSGYRTHPVMQKKFNGAGLYDMSGNVWEWCWDGYRYYGKAPVENPMGFIWGIDRSLRGGSWNTARDGSFVFRRLGIEPKYSFAEVGFRMAKATPAEGQ